MTQCTRCGTETERPPLDHNPMRSQSFFEEWNTVIWLCDQCVRELQEWIRNE